MITYQYGRVSNNYSIFNILVGMEKQGISEQGTGIRNNLREYKILIPDLLFSRYPSNPQAAVRSIKMHHLRSSTSGLIPHLRF